MAYCLGVGTRHPHLVELNVKNPKTRSNRHRTFQLLLNSRNRCRRPTRIYYNSDDKQLPLPPPPPTPPPPPQQQPTGIQLYSDIERWVMPLSVLLYAVSKLYELCFSSFVYICRLLTETVRQSQAGWSGFGDWSEVEVCLCVCVFCLF